MQKNEAAGFTGGFFFGTCAFVLLAASVALAAAGMVPFTEVMTKTHHVRTGDPITLAFAFYNRTHEPQRLRWYGAQSTVNLCIWQVATPAPSPTPSATPRGERRWVETAVVDPSIYTVSDEELSMQRARMIAPLVSVVPAADASSTFRPLTVIVEDSDEWFAPDRLTYRFNRTGVFVVGAVPSWRGLIENGLEKESCPAHPDSGTPEITVVNGTS